MSATASGKLLAVVAFFCFVGEVFSRSVGSQHMPTCDAGEFQCDSLMCIPDFWVCDRDPDCPGRDDEADCDMCETDEFMCASREECIPVSWRCDGDRDCDDGSDEMACEQQRRRQGSHGNPRHRGHQFFRHMRRKHLN